MKQLLGKRVLILPEDPTVNSFGIILEAPGQEEVKKEKAEYGEVVFVGDKIEEKDLIVPGVRVHFNWMAAKKFPYEGKDYILIREDDITGVFTV
jgi:co-chaperonin GroES (HSP10)